MPKVSVIIPVYNTEKFLPRCMESVCNQTLSDIEIICINDCSTDNSLEVLKKYPVKIIDLPENKGAAYARNRGIEAATGEYIGFVDSDDFVDLDFYEKLYTKAIKTGADAVKGEFWEINDSQPEPLMNPVYNLNSLINKNLAYFYFTFTSAIYKKNFILEHNINFPENICHMEDNYFTIKAAIFYKKIETVLDTKYYYVLTSNTRAKKQDFSKTVESVTEASNVILDLINSYKISEEHYMIVYSFILKQVMDFCEQNCDSANNKDYELLLMCIDNISKKCRYIDKNLYYLFKIKREIHNNHLVFLKKKLLQDLRNNVKWKGNIKSNACTNKN